MLKKQTLILSALLLASTAMLNTVSAAEKSKNTPTAGTCASVSKIGDACAWGDGKQMKFAGTVAGKKLFAASADESKTATWGCMGGTGAKSTDDGADNSNHVLGLSKDKACRIPTSAAFSVCEAKGAGFYVPAKDEVNLMYKNKDAIGGFKSGDPSYYWSSTEMDYSIAWYMNFKDGNWTNYYDKDSKFELRCVRSI